MKEIISMKNVNFSYDDKKEVLHNINFSVCEGEYITVLGHNGSGKSTLVKLINGLLLPTDGNVIVDGKDTKDAVNLLDVRRCCGMVFQNPDNQLIATSVEEDVAFGLENIGVKRENMEQRIDDALKAVSMLEYKIREPHLLSGGQKQRIAIAGILAMAPKVILLDEATAMLDPKGRNEVMEIIDRLNKERGITVIHVTHHMEQALYSSRSVVLSEGEIIIDDAPLKVFKDERIEKLSLEIPSVIKLINGLGLELDEFSYEKVWESICKLK